MTTHQTKAVVLDRIKARRLLGMNRLLKDLDNYARRLFKKTTVHHSVSEQTIRRYMCEVLRQPPPERIELDYTITPEGVQPVDDDTQPD